MQNNLGKNVFIVLNVLKCSLIRVNLSKNHHAGMIIALHHTLISIFNSCFIFLYVIDNIKMLMVN